MVTEFSLVGTRTSGAHGHRTWPSGHAGWRTGYDRVNTAQTSRPSLGVNDDGR